MGKDYNTIHLSNKGNSFSIRETPKGNVQIETIRYKKIISFEKFYKALKELCRERSR